MGLGLNRHIRLAVFATLTSVGLASVAPMAALAATSDQTAFIAHYEHNAQTEASLLQKAQASTSTSATASSYSSVVSGINQQILSLYAAEQALSNLETNVGSLNQTSAIVTTLQNRRTQLTAQSRAEVAKINQEGRNKKNRQLIEILKLKHQVTLKQLEEVNVQLKNTQGLKGAWRTSPLDGGLTDLQTTIYHLQASVIHYTNLWIQAEKPTTPSTATSITGLAYAQSSITVPASSTVAVPDVVAVLPVVKDQQNNILADIGVYSITGPASAVGVSIDPTTGTVTVQPGATLGGYIVTYTQGSVTESVALTLA